MVGPARGDDAGFVLVRVIVVQLGREVGLVGRVKVNQMPARECACAAERNSARGRRYASGEVARDSGRSSQDAA